ncbi:MAG: hypothetical protein A2788_01475 [Candidatus Abawacabacteria bacterium RIFCSPHIGHO2_01_FULL_46_8]|uniref:ABC transporter domain-containing protein n=1 Tax=Candidatus Abawacabacteria bacterium RIFCSPHIGHO2_01_FULL_46_8 TaxID=1817815 RepID=A0A1F4XMB2_9BACT|nr:MAG: hypothetical protein A2788_01475 [Candidatus Abawacabacteria bacterium RIFCSPHIGHO2_01_FULL_46_8]
MPIISIKKLSKTYVYHQKQEGIWGSFTSLFWREKMTAHALKPLDLEIKTGEFLGLLGPNGAGKTTLLKMLSGILYPTSGKAQVLGFTPWERKHDYLKQITLIMGQKQQLWWDLPAIESFRLNQAIYQIPDQQYQATLAELVDLLDLQDLIHKQVRQLSLGERMRCEIVAALLHRPKVIFLDEPTIGLDVIAANTIRAFFKRYNQEYKATIILTSHIMEDVHALCSRLIVLAKGKQIFAGNFADLFQRYVKNKEVTVSFHQQVSESALKALGEIVNVGKKYSVLSIPSNKCAAITRELLTKFPVEDISIKEPSATEVVRLLLSEVKDK